MMKVLVIINRDTIMNILIVGAGAVGGLFGSYLQKHGADVQWLVRSERLAQLQQGGLTVNVPGQSWTVQPRAYTAAQLRAAGATFDLVVLTNKAYGLAAVIADIQPLVAANTLILPLLNGLRHLEVLDGAFGAQRVLGGIAKTIATLADANTLQVNSAGSSLTVGARQPEQQAAVAEINRLLADAGILVEDGEQVMAAMWDKFCRMAALGAANCLLQGNVGEYMRSDAGGEVALQLLRECTDTAAASGYPLEAAAISGFQRALTNPKSSFNSSMYRDMGNGLPIEGDHLVGDMLKRAMQAGVECRMLPVAYAVLQTYSARLAAG
jgi:2-dehydropantoate 2-reductase